jgi:glycolate oxidase
MEPEADRWTISQDVAVPRSALSSMLTAAEHVGQLHGVDVTAVAHAGDGILHLSWSVPQHPLDGDTRPPSLLTAVDEVYAATSKLGGATSNVRGAGLLTQESDKAVTALRRDLRAVLDPHGVLGPDAQVAKESQDPKVRRERDSTVTSISSRSALSRTGRTQTYRLGIHEFRE